MYQQVRKYFLITKKKMLFQFFLKPLSSHFSQIIPETEDENGRDSDNSDVEQARLRVLCTRPISLGEQKPQWPDD